VPGSMQVRTLRRNSRRCRFFDLDLPQHAKIEQTSNAKKAPIHSLICRYDPLKSPTRFSEDPLFDLSMQNVSTGTARGFDPGSSRTVLPQQPWWCRFTTVIEFRFWLVACLSGAGFVIEIIDLRMLPEMTPWCSFCLYPSWPF
jgi:hypothetical protein